MEVFLFFSAAVAENLITKECMRSDMCDNVYSNGLRCCSGDLCNGAQHAGVFVPLLLAPLAIITLFIWSWTFSSLHSSCAASSVQKWRSHDGALLEALMIAEMYLEPSKEAWSKILICYWKCVLFTLYICISTLILYSLTHVTVPCILEYLNMYSLQ